MFEELEELVYKANKPLEDILNWMKNHKEDPYFKTKAGELLNKHICDMYMNHAYLFLDLSSIHLEEYFRLTDQTDKITQLEQCL